MNERMNKEELQLNEITDQIAKHYNFPSIKMKQSIRTHRHSLSDIVKIKDTQKVVLFLSRQKVH